jgi:hypothetical protein
LAVAWFVVFLLKRFIRKMLANELSHYSSLPQHEIPQVSKQVKNAFHVQHSEKSNRSTKEEILDLREKKKM